MFAGIVLSQNKKFKTDTTEKNYVSDRCEKLIVVNIRHIIFPRNRFINVLFIISFLCIIFIYKVFTI